MTITRIFFLAIRNEKILDIYVFIGEKRFTGWIWNWHVYFSVTRLLAFFTVSDKGNEFFFFLSFLFFSNLHGFRYS